MKELISVNGSISLPEDAKISVFDRGFLYGDGIYEVARSYDRVFFGLEDHIERLYNSARRIDLDIGMTPEALISELYRFYGHFGVDNAYMRIVVTRGSGKINLDPNSVHKPNIVVFLKELDPLDPALYEKGMDVVTAKVLRNSKKALDPNIKSGNYLNNIMALGEAKKQKAYDALMVNRDGQIVEGTTWNVFMVKDGVAITPPDDADILLGITRKILRGICQKEGIKWEERFFTPDELKKSDEAFSTGSVKEVMAIRTLDGVAIGSGKPGPLTLKLAKLYKDFVKDYCQKSSHFKRL